VGVTNIVKVHAVMTKPLRGQSNQWESVENAVKKAVEPLVIQMRSQSESIASLKDELQQVKNEENN